MMIEIEGQEEMVIHPDVQEKNEIIIPEEVIAAIRTGTITEETVEDIIMIDMTEVMEEDEEEEMIEGQEVEQDGEKVHHKKQVLVSEEVRHLRAQDR